MKFSRLEKIFSLIILIHFHEIGTLGASIILVTKSEENSSSQNKVYQFDVIQRFKPNSTDGNSSSERGELHTRLESSACGVDLNVNEKYLITSQFTDGNRIHISLCDFFEEISTVTEEQLKVFDGQYHCS